MLSCYLKYHLFRQVRVFEARSEEEKEQVFNFRYRIYHEEYKMIEPGYDHQRKILKDELDTHKQIILTYTVTKQAISSTCRSHYFQQTACPREMDGKYGLPELSIPSQHTLALSERLAVDKNIRGKYLAMVQTVYIATRLIRDLSTYFSFASCAPSLLRHYSRLGYRPYTSKLLQFDDRLEIPIAVIPDLKFLKESGSPVYPLMKKYCDPALLKQYEHYRPDILKNYLTQDASLDDLASDAFLKRRKSFFYHLKRPTADFLIRNGFFLTLPENGVLYTEKEHQQCQFVVISGQLILSKRGHTLIQLHAGDIVGEFGTFHDNYCRCVTVKAISDAQLLVLPRGILRKLYCFDTQLYANFTESYLKSIALREKKLICKLISSQR
ncbi:hypothetical protein DIZ81_09510 [Legionella taurinensis]|uniref:Cyclic nucleotide-binding domain-containing protein n=1 Tax=Legionella taurinensis TaxID=70611 RepID=A0AB38N2N6_9GAMM|nr:cyclic nucleotide-binding domain-containing protein [Legionella taurinensis]MDX1838042.1 cyclic nucleotide-binding domain-containing protein [Legionella taurinensis]PUT39373.1 hypothetical protein DB744_09520 [Legionella taurinensis]PUT41682.1 hypothetical protein DB746_08435 [Legionella taurinensis]PUT44516.1 hypothetical protein DB743_07650 [Legionella taurinensis]PUT46760.1 hypothetical protein DB745_09515 [Legionella taurinensis]